MSTKLIAKAILSDGSLGLAIPCGVAEAACVFYAVYWRIRFIAENQYLATGRLLGHVIAREIGHVLVGPHAHDCYGIMQHNFRIREAERILYFTSGLAKQLRRDLIKRDAVLGNSSAPPRHPVLARLERVFLVRT